MFTRSIQLFRLFGFPIRIDLSWFFIVVLVTWSLAAALFPDRYPGQTAGTYWTMGAAGAMGLFISIVLHELAHALVARRHQVEMRGITLFIFGGVAEMAGEPRSAKAEFQIAIAGPIASVLIALLSYGLWRIGDAAAWPVALRGVIWYLAMINAVLVGFNLIPAFPLDGGRVLRSILWQIKGSLRWATRVCSEIGSLFGAVLIALGVIQFIGGNVVAGVWSGLLGLFLRNAARMSYQQVLIRRMLEGEPVSRFMQTDLHTVGPDLTIRELVDDHVYRHHRKMFPVVDNGDVLGCVTIERIKGVPREQWDRQHVRDVLEPCSDENTISADADAMEALSRMSRSGDSRLLVIDRGRLRGIVALKDLLGFISLKIDLDGEMS